MAQYLGRKSGQVAKRNMQRSVANASLSVLENRVASDMVTPVIHPDDLETAV